MVVKEVTRSLSECVPPGCVCRAFLRRFCVMMNKLAILLLLVGLAGLATVAKDGQYYPTANPARRVSLETKMNLNYIPVVLSQTPLQKVAQIVAAKPRPTFRRAIELEVPPIEPIAITLSLQHRSPPCVVS